MSNAISFRRRAVALPTADTEKPRVLKSYPSQRSFYSGILQSDPHRLWPLPFFDRHVTIRNRRDDGGLVLHVGRICNQRSCGIAAQIFGTAIAPGEFNSRLGFDRPVEGASDA